jgi:hypothetical protein
MEYYRPPGGIDGLFRQYDRIVSYGGHSKGNKLQEPSVEPDATKAPPPPPNQPPNQLPDAPPWQAPEDRDTNANPTTTLGGLVAGATAAAAATAKQTARSSLRAALPELAEPLLGEGAAGASEAALGLAPEALGLAELAPGLALGLAGIAAVDTAERNVYKEAPTRQGDYGFVVDGKEVPMKPGFYEKPPLTAPKAQVTFARDEKGLDDAYANAYGQGTAYDPATKSLYIKGSSTPVDWAEDLTMIPFGRTAQSERYQQASRAYDDLLHRGNKVDRVVGHSLGGSVALEMQKNLQKKHVKVDSRTFGAPVADLTPFGRFYGKAERFRHPLDPVSIADRGAKWGSLKAYPHSYRGFSEKYDK